MSIPLMSSATAAPLLGKYPSPQPRCTTPAGPPQPDGRHPEMIAGAGCTVPVTFSFVDGAAPVVRARCRRLMTAAFQGARAGPLAALRIADRAAAAGRLAAHRGVSVRAILEAPCCLAPPLRRRFYRAL